MESAPYTTMESVALDIASQFLRPELFARITERIVFRPLDLETQKQILEVLIAAKLSVLDTYFERSLRSTGAPSWLSYCEPLTTGRRACACSGRRSIANLIRPAWRGLWRTIPEKGIFTYDSNAAVWY